MKLGNCPGPGDSVRGESDMGIAEEKKPEYREEGEGGRAWEVVEIGGYVVPEVLPARADSWLGRLKPGVSVLGRDWDDRGSVTVRGFAVDGRPGVMLTGVVLLEYEG